MKKKFLLLFLTLGLCSAAIPIIGSESEGYEADLLTETESELFGETVSESPPDSETDTSADTSGGEDPGGISEESSENSEDTAPEEQNSEDPYTEEVPASPPVAEDTASEEENSGDNILRAATETELHTQIENAPAHTDTTIIITSNLIISDTIQIPKDKNIKLITENTETTITRADGFSGEIFDVFGTLSVTNEENPGCILKISGSDSDNHSLLRVNEDASFSMDDSLVLCDNRAETGGAVFNRGTLTIRGGRITGNHASRGGAIYSEGRILLSGSPYIYDNYQSEETLPDNIELNGEQGVLETDSMFAEEAKVGVHVRDGYEDRLVLASDEGGVINVLPSILNDDEENSEIGADGRLKYRPVLTKVSDPVWLNPTTVSFTCISSADGEMYSAINASDGEVPVFDLSQEGQRVAKEEPFTIEFRGVDSEIPQTLYVLVKGDNQALSRKRSAAVDMSARPSEPTPLPTDTPVPTKEPEKEPTRSPQGPTESPDPVDEKPTSAPTPTTRAAVISDIQDSIVSGLDAPLRMIPNTFYGFTVYGAGTRNASPLPEPNVEGDTRYIPAYWMLEGGRTKQTQWKIGAPKGINEKRSIPIRIYFQKQVYKDGRWTADGEEYITRTVVTEPYNELTVTPGADSTYVAGAETEVSDLVTAAPNSGDSISTGSSTSENAKTLDKTRADIFMLLLLVSVSAITIVLLLRSGGDEDHEEE